MVQKQYTFSRNCTLNFEFLKILLFNIKEIETYGPEFLNLSTTDSLGWVFFYCWGLSRAFENVYSILVSVPFDARGFPLTQLRQPKMFPNIAKCYPEGKIASSW